MSLKTVNIKTCYESGVDNLVEDFYIPVLKEAINYDRLAGFFTSTSLAIAARGISSLIRNSGKIRIIASPRLTESDVAEILKAQIDPSFFLSKILLQELDGIENQFLNDHLGALGWMIARGSLEIKVALILDNDGYYLSEDQISQKGIFHQKVGVLKDSEGNVISFSGSINETAAGWLNNFEEFKVFKKWELGQEDYCNADILKFDDFWNSKSKHLRIINIPDAVSECLIQKSSGDPLDTISLNNYRKNKNEKRINDLSLYPFQKAAVDKWNTNDRRMIFEMATGTGKTRAALGCVNILLKETSPIAIIIACPQNTLSRQWKDELEKNNICSDGEIIADSTNPKWKMDLVDMLQDVSLGLKNSIVIYTTHDTCSSSDFIEKLKKYKKKTKYFFIGDEAHGLGASCTSRALQEFYDYRLGLSATPKRWYDEFGTKVLYDFFGDNPYEFSIKQALLTINPTTNKTFLCNYSYYPIFINLTEDELHKYSELSLKISKLAKFGLEDPERKKIFEYLIFGRANIHKNAFQKIEAFETVLDSIKNIEDLLIFVSPNQIQSIQKIMARRGIIASKFTENEGTVGELKYNGKSERQFLLEKFKERKIKALIAIKCLDEGIDIPSARLAILLASSTNPREYIQRIGRVIRQTVEPKTASIFDIIVCPDKEKLPDEIRQFELKIFNKEMERCLEIAQNAINNAEATSKIFSRINGE